MDSTTSHPGLIRRYGKRVLKLRQLLSDERGVSAIEYALLASLIAVACIGGVSATGNSVTQLYTYWTDAVREALRT